ncbi:type II toxin-antitoxin system RelE/ParE family toxin [Halomonas alkalisoli]|jgi:toxin HigB-1|uniref:type II toxin-antitoxin system RelE/ParE family toxin n=1 Tax=Halomonas alkalisoli TaxID=2907158 RepID=UPI001F3F65DF|nr:type II toxin-antitoxin system RelE/ParE family toxin [Halomonas alkalisoli]MCE9681118.1 type II toxin-antitoxin system RelE/ParE family toxin [Halomonas alkalisoli]
MIESFACKRTQRLFEGAGCANAFRAFRRQAERKLQLLDSATTLDFLRSPPGNRLEALRGDRQGQYSIRINDQWRICFRFENGAAFDVEIVDYH